MDMLRLERPGLRAAARAETGVEPREEGERFRPFVPALGEREWVLGDPFGGSEDWEGVPGFRGGADITTRYQGAVTQTGANYTDSCWVTQEWRSERIEK